MTATSSSRQYGSLLRDITEVCVSTSSYASLAHDSAAALLHSIKSDIRHDELIFKNNSQLMLSLDGVSDVNKNIVVIKEQLLLGVIGETIRKKYYKDHHVLYNPQLLIEPYLLSADQRELLSSLKKFVELYVENKVLQSREKHLDENKILEIITYFLKHGRRRLVKEHVLSDGSFSAAAAAASDGDGSDNAATREESTNSAGVKDICCALMDSLKMPKHRTFIVNNCSYSSNNYDSTSSDLSRHHSTSESSINFDGLHTINSKLSGTLLPQMLRTRIYLNVLANENKNHERNSRLGAFSASTSSGARTNAVSEYELSKVSVSAFISTAVARAVEETFPIAIYHINRSIHNKVNSFTYAIDTENNGTTKDSTNYVSQNYQNNHLLIKNKHQLKLLMKKTDLLVEALFTLNGNVSDRLVRLALLLVHVFEDDMHFLSSDMLAIHNFVTLTLLPSKTYHRSYSVINMSIRSFRLLSDFDPEVIRCLKVIHRAEAPNQLQNKDTADNKEQSSKTGASEGAVALFLFEDWLESCFLGHMSEYCVLYIWDQLVLGGCKPELFEEKLPVICCVIMTLLRDAVVNHFNKHYVNDSKNVDENDSPQGSPLKQSSIIKGASSSSRGRPVAPPKIMDTIRSEGKKIALKDLIAATVIVFTQHTPSGAEAANL